MNLYEYSIRPYDKLLLFCIAITGIIGTGYLLNQDHTRKIKPSNEQTRIPISSKQDATITYSTFLMEPKTSKKTSIKPQSALYTNK